MYRKIWKSIDKYGNIRKYIEAEIPPSTVRSRQASFGSQRIHLSLAGNHSRRNANRYSKRDYGRLS